jgi:hypothetical protein
MMFLKAQISGDGLWHIWGSDVIRRASPSCFGISQFFKITTGSIFTVCNACMYF